MPSKRSIFDAHHHLWDLRVCHYPWLEARGVRRFFGDPTPIQKNYLPQDFVKDAAGFALRGSVHVQVGVAAQDELKETRWLQQQSEKPPFLPGAIVAFADLTQPDLPVRLDAHASCAAFRGVRQIIGRHVSEDAAAAPVHRHPHFFAGLQELQARALRFDLQCIAPQYEAVFHLLERLPNLRTAICHFASPWDQSAQGFAHWRESMRRFAQLPHVMIKFSGFGMFKPDWQAEDIKPYVEAALELFGQGRCMAGSNFPVDKLYGGYARIWRALEELLPDESSKRAVMLENGQRFYAPEPQRRVN